MSQTFSRSQIAASCNLPTSQIDYLIKLELVAPDVGDQRKVFSSEEAAFVKICAAAVKYGVQPQRLSEPLAWLREAVALPEGVVFSSLGDLYLRYQANLVQSIWRNLGVEDWHDKGMNLLMPVCFSVLKDDWGFLSDTDMRDNFDKARTVDAVQDLSLIHI